MRILHIIATLNPEAGGPVESVRVLLGFSPIGYAGEVVTMDDPQAPFLQGIPFPVYAMGPTHSIYSFNLRLIPWLMKNRHRFDGIIVNGIWQFCGLATLLTVAGRQPYMVFTHGMLDPYFKRAFPFKHIKKWLYWAPVEYWVLRNAYRVLFTSQPEKKLAEQSFWLHHWNPYVVPYGASGPTAEEPMLREAFYTAFPALRDKRFLLFLGRIHRKKGCDLLVEAFAKIAAKDPDLCLVMAGPDQQGWQPKLRALAEGLGIAHRVFWPGMIRGNLKWGAFYACEAFILPSHQENFGIAVAEALACARPALLSDKVNIAQTVTDTGAAYMELDTAEGTLNLLERWIATPESERELMRQRALQTFRSHYDMKENARTIIRLFEQASREYNEQHEHKLVKKLEDKNDTEGV